MKQYPVLILSTLLILLLAMPLYSAASMETKRILILYSEDQGHPAHRITEQGIRAVFSSNKLFDVNLYSEYLDLSRFSDSSYAHNFADYLKVKYFGLNIQAIIAVYPEAVTFLTEERHIAFPGVPIIATEITRGFADELERSTSRQFVTGTIILTDNIAGLLLDEAIRLRPETKRVALIAGTAPNDTYSEKLFRSSIGHYGRKIDLIDLAKLSMEETLARVGSLEPDTIILFASLFKDGAGKTFTPREALSTISRASTVPVFGLYESYLGFGIVGGPMMSFEKHGEEAATLAIRIMNGESPASIPMGGEKANLIAYDWRELKRWGISEKDLPAGSAVRYREFSFWDRYKWHFAGIMLFCILETCLIISLKRNLRKRHGIEKELRDSEIKYRTVAMSSHEMVYWEDSDGKLRYISPSTEIITGYRDGEFIENPALIREIIVPEDRESWDRHRNVCFQEPMSHDIQFRICRKDGQIRWVEHRCQPVEESNG